MKFLTKALPGWLVWTVLAVAFTATWFLGQIHGERITGEKHIEYVTEQLARSARIGVAMNKVVDKVRIEYVDRVKKIYVKGDVIQKEVPVYVTQADNDQCTVNAGFVRSQNAAWTGESAGGPDATDRADSGVSLAEVAETDAYNATVCLAIKERAIWWERYYRELKAAIDETK